MPLESCLPWMLLEMFRVSPSLVLLRTERWGLGAKAGGRGGEGESRCAPACRPSRRTVLPIVRAHLRAGRKPAQFSFLFTERLLTLVPQILFFPPSIPRAPALWPCPPLPTAPLAAAPSNGEAADKGAFLQSGSPSSHKFSGPA